jgi:hypothetical protein
MIYATKRSRTSGLRDLGFVGLVAWSLAVAGCGDVNIEGPDWCGSDGFCEPSTPAYQAQETFDIRAAVLPELSLIGVAGSIEILGVPSAAEIVIEGTRQVRSHSTDDAQIGLDELEVAVRESGETLFVETRQPSNSRGRTYQVHYRLSIPESVALSLEQAAGRVEVRSVRADVEVQAAAGTIALEDLHGNVRVRAAAGEIEVSTEVQPNGVVDLGTGAGAIRLRIPRGTSAWLEAASAAGRVNIVDLSMDDLDPRASAVRGTLGNGNGTIRVHTAAGNITISGNG